MKIVMDLLYFQNRYKHNQVFESILKTIRGFEEKKASDASPASSRGSLINHDIAFMLARLGFNIELFDTDGKVWIVTYNCQAGWL